MSIELVLPFSHLILCGLVDLKISYLLEIKRSALSSYSFQLIKLFLVSDMVLMLLMFSTHVFFFSFVVTMIFLLRPDFPDCWTSFQNYEADRFSSVFSFFLNLNLFILIGG